MTPPTTLDLLARDRAHLYHGTTMAAILREGADTVAMFIAEPVMGVGGVLVPPDDYFPRIREICSAHASGAGGRCDSSARRA